jgi:hypothetical protein
MNYSDQVVKLVADLVVPEKQRLSFAALAKQDEADARLVEANIQDYLHRVKPIVDQLRKFSGKNFPIEFERHYRRGLAKAGGVISIDFATLNKPLSELALTLAHEWGHQSLGHLMNAYCSHGSSISEPEAEHEADYYAGLFLGMHAYDVQELIKIRLSMPEIDPAHGSRFERACIVAQGYHDGVHMHRATLQANPLPGFSAFRSHYSEAPWHQSPETPKKEEGDQESNARKPAK